MQNKGTSADIKQQVNNSSTQTAINIKYDKEMQVNFESNIQNQEIQNQNELDEYRQKLNEKENMMKQL